MIKKFSLLHLWEIIIPNHGTLGKTIYHKCAIRHSFPKRILNSKQNYSYLRKTLVLIHFLSQRHLLVSSKQIQSSHLTLFFLLLHSVSVSLSQKKYFSKRKKVSTERSFCFESSIFVTIKVYVSSIPMCYLRIHFNQYLMSAENSYKKKVLSIIG